LAATLHGDRPVQPYTTAWLWPRGRVPAGAQGLVRWTALAEPVARALRERVLPNLPETLDLDGTLWRVAGWSIGSAVRSPAPAAGCQGPPHWGLPTADWAAGWSVSAAPHAPAPAAGCQGPGAGARSAGPAPGPLGTQPPEGQGVRSLTVEQLMRFESIRLFAERARAVDPDFAVTDENALAVAEICRRLDGLPLALELAAAQVELFSPQETLARLDRRLPLLTGGAPDLPARQQSLQATITWSYDLLHAREQRLFWRLAVFHGGFALEAVEAVCNADGALGRDVLDEMESLVGKSLLRHEEMAGGEPWFSMLDTIREYALEQLEVSGEADALRRQHGAYYLALADRVEPELAGPEQAGRLDRLEADHDDLRAALRWLADRGEAERALRLGGALWWFWWVRGYLTEGRQRLAEMLALPGAAGRTAARAKALHGAGVLAHRQADYAAARALLEESLAIRRELGDQEDVAWSLTYLGNVARYQSELVTARALLEESLTMWRMLGNPRGTARSLGHFAIVAHDQGDHVTAAARLEESLTIWRQVGDRQSVAQTLINLGEVARWQGDYERAAALYEEGLALHRQLSNKGSIALALQNLGHAALYQGQISRAAALFRESLALFLELGNRRHVVLCLAGLAGVAAGEGQPERAARLLGAAAAELEALGAPLEPIDRADYERHQAAARAALGTGAWAAARAEGRAMGLHRAIAHALEEVTDHG
jgi:predicted ATPase